MAPDINMLGQDPFLRIKNSIYRHSLTHDNFTIQTIAGLTGFSTTTIAKYVNQMKDEGTLVPLSCDDTNRKGRKATTYAIKMAPTYFLGVDVRRFGLGLGLMNLNGTMVRVDKDAEYLHEDSKEGREALCARVESYIDALEDLDKSQIAGINFNFNGRVDQTLADKLSDRMGIPSFVENDTKAMAYGEYQSSEQDYRNVLYVNVSWGLGMGIIIDGKLYTGSQGFAGEIGHMPYYNNNVLCHCGKKGCIETEVSISAIKRKLLKRIKDGESSVLSEKVLKGEDLGLDDILDAIDKEDPLCIELVSWTGHELGKHLSGMISLFNPDCIIIAGPLTSIPAYCFMQPAILSVKQFTPRSLSQHVNIVTSQLGEEAGITGACLIARNRAIMSGSEPTVISPQKSMEVPFIEELETIDSWQFESAMMRNTVGAAIDVVNWPDLYAYCPKCVVRMAHSHNYLALSFNVSGMDLRATEMSDNGRSWEDSCCELFISPDGKEYYNIEVTCIGSIRVGKGSSRHDRSLLPLEEVAKIRRWSSLEHKHYEEEGGSYSWNVDLMIPFEVIGLDPDNLPEYVTGNIYKCGDLTAHPHFVSWNPITCEKPDFHRPECFGKFMLGK